MKQYVDERVEERLKESTHEEQDDTAVPVRRTSPAAKRSLVPQVTPMHPPKRRRRTPSLDPASRILQPADHLLNKRPSFQISSPHQSPLRPSSRVSKSPMLRRLSTASRRISQSSTHSNISSHVSPMSDSYPDYCDYIVNTVLDNFHDERTPTAPLPSSIQGSENDRPAYGTPGGKCKEFYI